MSDKDANAKRRIQRARHCARLILEQAGYRVNLSHGVLEARRKTEIRRIMVYLSRRDIPKPDQLPPGHEAWIKIGRNRFL